MRKSSILSDYGINADSTGSSMLIGAAEDKTTRDNLTELKARYLEQFPKIAEFSDSTAGESNRIPIAMDSIITIQKVKDDSGQLNDLRFTVTKNRHKED